MKYINYGIVFYISRLSCSGKSTIGKHLKPVLEKKYGKKILVYGDEIREIFKFKSYIKAL